VLLPTNETALRFHFYLVTLSETYPLAQTLSKLLMYQGSEGFEQRRETAEWHLLYATVELMKALFWVGQEASQFPCESWSKKSGKGKALASAEPPAAPWC